MPLPANCIIADAVTDTGNIIVKNRFYFEPTGPYPSDAGQARAVANAIFDALSPVLTPLLSRFATFRSIYLRSLSGTADVDAFSTRNAISGTAGDLATPAAVALPDEVCLCVQRRTGLKGRNKRGRLFFSGIAEAVNDGNFVDSFYANEALDLAGWCAASIPIGIEGLAATHLNHRHYDRKTNVLEPIVEARVLQMFMSRRDRRQQDKSGLTVIYNPPEP